MNTDTTPYLINASLEWHKGPALGGIGTAGCLKDGTALWWDGELLLIVVDLGAGDMEIALVSISCDCDYFSVTDSTTGDSYDAWGPESWSWWAKIGGETKNLPPLDK